MKSNDTPKLLAAALVGALAVTTATAFADNMPAFNSSLALAPADTSAGGGDAAAADQEADLAKKLNNPVADLISVPIQNNWDFGIGPAHAMKYTANIQPVIPFHITEGWNLITRTIVPIIYQEPLVNNPKAPVSVSKSHAGFGDTTQSFFFSPKDPVHGWILGAGPVGYYPTANSGYLGSGQWGAGPTVLALRQEHGFTYGVLANQIWSFAGQSDRKEVNYLYVQPFVAYTTKTYTTFAVNSESSYNWQDNESTVPMNYMIQQVLKIGGHPIAFQLGYRYYIEKPNGGPDWGLRFTVTFLFPKKN